LEVCAERALSELELTIDDLSHEGRGVAHVDGKAWFVAGALPGERVRARRTAKHRQYDEAEVLEVLEASPDRVVPTCPHFGTCAGCSLQHLAPAAQIAAKQRTLLENLERIGHVTPARVLAPLQGAPWGYRRRGRLSAKWVEKKGRMLVGFRETNGRYVAELTRCPVLHPAIGERIEPLARLIESMAARSEIPQVEFAVGDGQGALVFRHLVELGAEDRARLVGFARETGLYIYLQSGGLDSVQALEPADAALSFALAAYDVTLAFRPLDFIQVNDDINARMIDHALALLDPQPGDRVLDLFCGLGNFTLPLARRAAHVTGVEGEAGLVQRARDNAALNGIGNVEYHAANLAEDQRDASWARAKHDLVLLDPPRAGAAEVLAYLPRKDTRRVVYVSCHPASLARDAGVLVREHRFKLAAAGVMDMFPHTGHVESIAVFER
jgi:23S rRNA (uracil1939-C5)-methyltransferase